MADQVYWDDVEEGAELPEVVKNPTTQQLVKYAGASGDYYQIHYDKDFAKNNELDEVTRWMGPNGDLKRLACQYRGMDIPGSPVTAKGVVTRKYQEQGVGLIDCEIWLENKDGEKTTPGSATVALPRR